MPCEIPNFFVTNMYNPVKKIFVHINEECRKRKIRLTRSDGKPGKILQFSATLLRKLVSTEASSHSPELNRTVAAALRHSELVTARHYVLGTVQDAMDQRSALRVVDNSALMRDYIIQK